MRRSSLKMVLLLVATGLAVAVAFPPAFRAGPRYSLDDIQRVGVIRIGYSIEPPYAWPDAEGRVTGEAAEVARLVAARLGIPRIEWRMTDFGALLDGLQSGDIDVAAASMFITEERRRRVDFSIPSLRVQQGLLVCWGNPLGLHAYEDAVAHTSAVVALLAGAVEIGLLERLGLPDRRRLIVPDAEAGLAALLDGSADALALTDVAVHRLALDQQYVEAARPFRQPGPEAGPRLSDCGFAFRKGDDSLRRAWDTELAGLLGRPEHLALLERFGLSASHVPDPGAGAAP